MPAKLAGKKFGLGVRETYQRVFLLNEIKPRKLRMKAGLSGAKPLTDHDIFKFVASEFGYGKRLDDAPAYMSQVTNMRCRYNNGTLVNGKPPKRKSNRYDDSGEKMGEWAKYTDGGVARQYYGETKARVGKKKKKDKGGKVLAKKSMKVVGKTPKLKKLKLKKLSRR